MLATLGVVPNAAALPADATAGPVPTSETPAPPAATRTLPPVITAPIGLARSYSYTFKLNSFRITDTRSVHNDTDFVSIAVAVGSNAPVTLPAVSMGDLNNGTYPVNISIPNIEVAAGERVAFSYSIVNTGYDQNTVEHDLSSAVASAASKAAGAGGGALAGPVGEVIGSAAGGWLIGKLDTIIFADCDGTVAAGDHTWIGSQLAQMAGGKTLTTEDNNQGTDSPTGCGRNSQYYVTWSVTGKPIGPVMKR